MTINIESIELLGIEIERLKAKLKILEAKRERLLEDFFSYYKENPS